MGHGPTFYCLKTHASQMLVHHRSLGLQALEASEAEVALNFFLEKNELKSCSSWQRLDSTCRHNKRSVFFSPMPENGPTYQNPAEWGHLPRR